MADKPFGPLDAGTFTIKGDPADGKPPANVVTVKKSNGDDVPEPTTEMNVGYGNNIPHYQVVNNMIAGVKLRDPVKVKSLNYFDEKVESVDGIQEA